MVETGCTPLALASPFPDFHSRWLGTDSLSSGSWLQALKPDTICVILLIQGRLRIEWNTDGPFQDIQSNSLLWFNAAAGLPCRIIPLPGTSHEALVLTYPIQWVQNSLGSLGKEISADFRTLLLGPQPSYPIISRHLEAEDRSWGRGLMAPTLCSLARELLEGSRMSEFFFRKILTESKGEELFCTRTRRLALERVSKVRTALLANLDTPPSLEELARLCGCNPQYLSRTFSETAGATISLYLRRLRIEKAAELIGSGRCNASEAALEVGYRSLSHFSQAFRAEKDCPPSEWVRRSSRQTITAKDKHVAA